MSTTHVNIPTHLRIILPMAGKGQRFRDKGYQQPKPLIEVQGRPMLERACNSLSFFKEFPRENIIAIVRGEDEQQHDMTRHLRKMLGEGIHVLIDPSPAGAATTALMAKDLINDERPIIIMDCDILFKAATFEQLLRSPAGVNGAIPVFKAEGDHWSFSTLRDDTSIEHIAEKKRISPFANIGCYYFAQGQTFVEYAEAVARDDKKTKGEFYVSTVVNRMIEDGLRIFGVKAERFDSLGTPAGLDAYLNKQRTTATLPKQTGRTTNGKRLSQQGASAEVQEPHVAMPPALIAAAGPPRAQLRLTSSGICSAGMIPVNGRPALGWTIGALRKQGFKEIHILKREHDTHLSDYIAWRNWPDSLQIDCEDVEGDAEPEGLAHSLCIGMTSIFDRNRLGTGGILIVLGHTIITSKLPPCDKEDWALYAKVEEETSRWCYVDIDDRSFVKDLVDRPAERTLPDNALIGAYYFADRRLLLSCLHETIVHRVKICGTYQLSSTMQLYMKHRKIRAIPVEDWYDCGSIRGIQRSRRGLLAARSFNSIEVSSDLGVLSKKSKQVVDIHREYSWYTGVPKEFACIVPRVVEHRACKSSNKEEQAELLLEYYGYNSLEEAWVYQELADDVWRTVLRHVLSIARRFREYRAPVSPADFKSIYIEKTHSRIGDLVRTDVAKVWQRILEYQEITINDTRRHGWPSLITSVESRCEQLYNAEHCTIIHGDLQLANILYDFNTGSIKLIDPRGSFGQSAIFGDCKYDLAKLRHSLHGKYNHIVNDLFLVADEENCFNLRFPERAERTSVVCWFDRAVVDAGFDLDHVKLIEALLFMSMLPLHGDQPKRQLAMFLQGISLLNEVIVRRKPRTSANASIALAHPRVREIGGTNPTPRIRTRTD